LILQEEAVGEVLLIWLQFSSVVVDLWLDDQNITADT
jgi:hypothetical protein